MYSSECHMLFASFRRSCATYLIWLQEQFMLFLADFSYEVSFMNVTDSDSCPANCFGRLYLPSKRIASICNILRRYHPNREP